MLKKQLRFISGILAAILLASLVSTALAKEIEKATFSINQDDLVIEYPISGSALNIVSAGPNDIWFTMPAANKIGHIVVDASGMATVTELSAPTANSEPYDLVYDGANNVIWFTQRSASQLGRLDIATQTITEISSIPTANSMPAGITLAPDGSIWFAESGANKIGQYIPSTNTFTESTVYIPETAGVTNAELHDIAISESGNKLWVTAPADHLVLQYFTSTDNFSSISLGSPFDTIAASSRQPYNITYAGGNVVWLTDIANNQVGLLFQGTLSNVAWYTLPTSGSSPTGIAFGATGGGGTVFFTGNATSLAGSISNGGDGSRTLQEYSLSSGSQPSGITMDPSGNVWIALSGSNTIALWQPPYYETVFLPLVAQN